MHVYSSLTDLDVGYKHIKSLAGGKQLEKASLSLKYLSNIITAVWKY